MDIVGIYGAINAWWASFHIWREDHQSDIHADAKRLKTVG
jgi:hypothetical protein